MHRGGEGGEGLILVLVGIALDGEINRVVDHLEHCTLVIEYRQLGAGQYSHVAEALEELDAAVEAPPARGVGEFEDAGGRRTDVAGRALDESEAAAAEVDLAPVDALLVVARQADFEHGCFDQHLASGGALHLVDELAHPFMLPSRCPYRDHTGLGVSDHRGGFAIDVPWRRGGSGLRQIHREIDARAILLLAFGRGGRLRLGRVLLCAFRHEFVGFAKQILDVLDQRFPEVILRAVADLGERAVAGRAAAADAARAAGDSGRGDLGRDRDGAGGVAVHQHIVDVIGAQEWRIRHDGQGAVLEFVAHVNLLGDPRHELRQGLVDGVEGDEAFESGVHIDVDLRVTGQREEQLLYRYLADHHRVGFELRGRLGGRQAEASGDWCGNGCRGRLGRGAALQMPAGRRLRRHLGACSQKCCGKQWKKRAYFHFMCLVDGPMLAFYGNSSTAL